MTKRKRRHISPEYIFSEVEMHAIHDAIMDLSIQLGDTALTVWQMVMRRTTLTHEDLSNLDAFRIPTIPEQQFVQTVSWIVNRIERQLPNDPQEKRDRAAVPLVFLWMQSTPPIHQHTAEVPTYTPTPKEA